MFTFTYEVMFLPRFVCLFVGLSVSRIILKTLWMMNSHEMFTSVASGTKKIVIAYAKLIVTWEWRGQRQRASVDQTILEHQ